MLTRLVMTACATLLALSLPTPAVGQPLPPPDNYIVVDGQDEPLGLVVTLWPDAAITIPVGDGTWSALVGLTTGSGQLRLLWSTFGWDVLYETTTCEGPMWVGAQGSRSILPGLVHPVALIREGIVVPDMVEELRLVTIRRALFRGQCREHEIPELVRPALLVPGPVGPVRLVPRWATPP